ncbi:MAG TPA: MFS transporter [Mycobacteriales bacterium]|nr:MFS transporter [Mycobacteriales bacterium]
MTDGILARPFRASTLGILGLISLIAFEAIAVATALPTAVRALDGLAWYGWSFTALLGTSIVAMVVAGELADRVGGRLPLVIGVSSFLAGLLTAGLAPNMAAFLLGRALQGVGVGLLIVVMYVIVGDQYPEALRPKVFGAISAAWVVPSLVGPVVAGALAQGPGWRWVFLGLVPLVVIAVVSLLPTLRRLRRPAEPAAATPGRRFAAVGAAAGVAAVQWSLQELSWLRVPVLVAGLVLIVLVLRVLLPRGTAHVRRGVPAVVAFRGLMAGTFFSVESLVPLTLTLVHGYSPTSAGVPLTVGALGWSGASLWQARRGDVARHTLVRACFLLVAVAAAGMAVVAQPWSPAWVIYPVWVAGGFGMGLGMTSLSVLLLQLSPPAERGINSSALQLADSTGSALCIGLGGALVAAAARDVLPLGRAVGSLDLLMCAVALGAALLAGRARPPARVAASPRGAEAVR